NLFVKIRSLCGSVHQVVANTVPRQRALAVQQDEFVLSQANGIDNVNLLAIASVLACKSQFCFCQLGDSRRQVIRDRHFPSFDTASSARELFSYSPVAGRPTDQQRSIPLAKTASMMVCVGSSQRMERSNKGKKLVKIWTGCGNQGWISGNFCPPARLVTGLVLVQTMEWISALR